MTDWSEQFPAVHRAIAPEYRSLPQEHVELIVEELFGPGVGLADAEGFFSDIGSTLSSVGRAVAPIAGPALQGALSGGAGGAALGPYGALAGAVIGGVSSAVGAATAPRPRRPPPPRPPAPVPSAAAPPPPAAAPQPPRAAQPAPPVPRRPRVPLRLPAVAPPGPAVPQLLSALASPTVQDALAALLMGRAGAPTVAGAGDQQVSTPSILNMLGVLTGQAAAEAESWEPDSESLDPGESFDESDPEARAEQVFGQLAAPRWFPESDGEAESAGEGESEAESAGEAESEGIAASDGESDAELVGVGEGSDEDWLDDMYDELEAEFYAAELAEAAYDG